MATLDEVYESVVADEAQRAAFVEASATEEGVASFLVQRGCEVTPEQVAAFLAEKRSEQGEMSDAELDAVAGGCSVGESLVSLLASTLICRGLAVTREVYDKGVPESGVRFSG